MKIRALLFTLFFAPLLINGVFSLALQPAPCFADTCPACAGRGAIPCSQCGGTGIGGYGALKGQTAAYGCEACGGVRGDPVQGTGRRGSGYITCPTCGGSGQAVGQVSSSSYPVPSFNDQQALEEDRKREQEKEKQKREEFERSKQEALKSMKGIAEKEFGLKYTGAADVPKLKEARGIKTGDSGEIKTLFEKGTQGLAPAVDFRAKGPSKLGVPENRPKSNSKNIDVSLVDLSFLDQNSPIILDPNVVQGKKRVFPVQLNSEVYSNINHNKGLDALLRREPLLAVKYFERAQKELPNDPIIRNDLLLAQDLVKVQNQTDEQKRLKSKDWTKQAIVSLMYNDADSALTYVTAARDLWPNDNFFNNLIPHIKKIAQETARDDRAGKRFAYLLVGQAIALVAQGDSATAVNRMEKAHKINPEDEYIASVLKHMQNSIKKNNSA